MHLSFILSTEPIIPRTHMTFRILFCSKRKEDKRYVWQTDYIRVDQASSRLDEQALLPINQ
jgi:hypothetical protein